MSKTNRAMTMAGPAGPAGNLVPVNNKPAKIINALTQRIMALRAELDRSKAIIRRLEAGHRRVRCCSCGATVWCGPDGTPPADWGYAGVIELNVDAYVCPDCRAIGSGACPGGNA